MCNSNWIHLCNSNSDSTNRKWNFPWSPDCHIFQEYMKDWKAYHIWFSIHHVDMICFCSVRATIFSILLFKYIIQLQHFQYFTERHQNETHHRLAPFHTKKSLRRLRKWISSFWNQLIVIQAKYSMNAFSLNRFDFYIVSFHVMNNKKSNKQTSKYIFCWLRIICLCILLLFHIQNRWKSITMYECTVCRMKYVLGYCNSWNSVNLQILLDKEKRLIVVNFLTALWPLCDR